MNKWTKKFPTKKGLYWFYGYRYGRKSIALPDHEKKFILVKVYHDALKNPMYIAEGQFMYQSEVEEALFCKATYPEIPKWEG